MKDRPGVVVAIPAHDEETTIRATLEHVLGALDHAVRRGAVSDVAVAVAAHRCSDATAELARSVLARSSGFSGGVVDETGSDTIGEVRDHAVHRGLGRLGGDRRKTWILSTDADTVVPRRWVVDVLGAAASHDAAAVVGLADLDRFRGSAGACAEYEAILAGKLVAADELRQHDHVFGANLAVRGDSYLAVGGFPHVRHGEDQALVDLLIGAGQRVLRTREVVVTTSGRLDGRAPAGLASLLRRLDEPRQRSGRKQSAPPLTAPAIG